MKPHHYEVYALAYGGRNCIKKVPEQDIPKSFVEKITTEYIFNMKSMCMRFLTTHCSEEELRKVLDVYGIQTNVNFVSEPTYATSNQHRTRNCYSSKNIFKTKSNIGGLKI